MQNCYLTLKFNFADSFYIDIYKCNMRQSESKSDIYI